VIPQVPLGINGHSDTIRQAVEAASPRPLYITEYSVGDHDDPSAAAGILTYIPRLQGPEGPQIYSYWAFSDGEGKTRLICRTHNYRCLPLSHASRTDINSVCYMWQCKH
jgi:hypothetical protein